MSLSTPTGSQKPGREGRRLSSLPVAGKADCVNFNVMVRHKL